MPLVDTARVDTDLPGSGNPAPNTFTMNLLLKDSVTYNGTQTASRSKVANFDFALADWVPLVFVDSNSASDIIGTVRPNSIVAFPIGAVINLCRRGAGDFTVAPGTGVTIQKPSDRGLSLRAQWSLAMLRKIGTNEWILGGDLT